MEEQLITFETAKLAKEKGFNASCHELYRKMDNELIIGRNYASNLTTTGCIAPTQSLLQKWLREEHKIHIDVIHFIDQPINNEIWPDCYQFFVDGEAFHPYCKTYEETLEHGLLEALKLIK